MAGSATAPWTPAQPPPRMGQRDNWSNIKPWGYLQGSPPFSSRSSTTRFTGALLEEFYYKAPGVGEDSVPKIPQAKSCKGLCKLASPRGPKEKMR